MLIAKDFRRIAREALNGKWALAIGTGFVYTLIGGTISSYISNPYDFTTREEKLYYFREWLNTDLGMSMIPWIIGLLIVVCIYLVVTLVIGGAIEFGYTIFNLNLVDGKDAYFSDLFSQFNRIDAGFCMRFLRVFYTMLWTLLLIVPGIVAYYSYAMTPYIMVEHPDYGANEAIRYSKQLMDGNKGRLFCMGFSFIGWEILSILTFGIGYLWLAPYKEAATAAFYREITGNEYNSENSYKDY